MPIIVTLDLPFCQRESSIAFMALFQQMKVKKTLVKPEGDEVSVQDLINVSQEVGKTAHVLHSVSETDGKIYVISCNEVPADDVCRDCPERFKCHFSKAKETF